jgi:uncharacterized protein YceK
MNTQRKTKSIWLLLIAAFLLSGCASTTMLTTVPPGARVYVKGEALGTTPYKYSDTKPALSSTFITFKKQGFKDLEVVLKRNEQPAWGAIIGGVFIYVPLLWFAEYKANHFYELERASGTELNEAFYSETDTLIKSEVDKIAAVEKPVENMPGMTDTSLYKTTEAPGLDFSKRKISQFGIGGGLCTWALFLGMDFTYIGPKNNGVNIGWNANMFKTPDVPADYDRFFTPMDYLNIFSINYVRALPTTKNDVRFRLEAGPSCVFYSKATIVNNPSYNPNHSEDEWFWSFDWLNNDWKHKYNKERSTLSSIGASLAARMEYLVSPSLDFEISLFANLNNLKSIIGLGFFLNFGDVKD